MALEKATAAIPFVGGLDTKTYEHVLPPDKLNRLENGEFTKHGVVRMRPGHDLLAATTALGSDYENSAAIYGNKLGLFTRGDTLLLATDELIYASDPGLDAWHLQKRFQPATHTITEVSQVPATQSLPGVATAGVLRAFIWEDSRGGIKASVYNVNTGHCYVHDYSLAVADAVRPHAVAVGNAIVLMWADESTDAIVGVRITSNVVESITSSTNYVGDLASTSEYSAVASADGSAIYIAYNSDGSVVAAGCAIACVRPDGVTQFKKETALGSFDACDIAVHEPSGTVGVVISKNGFGGDVDRQILNLSTGTLSTPTSTTLSRPVLRVAIGPTGNSSNPDSDNFVVGYEINQASIANRYVEIRTATTDDTLATIRHASLASTGFQRGSNTKCNFLLLHESRTGLQNAYYAVDEDGAHWGQLLYQVAANAHETRMQVAKFTAGNEIALGFRRKLDTDGDDVAAFSHAGIAHVTFDWAPKLSSAESGKTAYLSGSMLWAFDGTELAEANMLMYPDMLDSDLTPSNGTGGLNSEGLTGTYSYRVYYVRTRTNGEKIRSAAITITVELDATDDTVSISIPSNAHTLYGYEYDDVYTENHTVEVYRGVFNDESGLYYRCSGDDPSVVSGSNRFIYNDVASSTLTTFVDELSDADLISHEIDYLSQGELENITPPGPAFVQTIGSRMFLAGGAIPEHQVWYSKLQFPGEACHFTDLCTVDLPPFVGPVTALSYINETAVVFKAEGIFGLQGDGVDNTGTSGGFNPQRVTADLGCTGTSVVSPAGVMFTSAKGIYQLDQSFNVTYVGAAVERFNGQTFVGGLVIPGTSQCLFLTSSGSSVMLDYVFGEWASWTLEGTSIVRYGTSYAMLRNNGSVLVRNPDVYLDGGSRYSFLLRTGAFRASTDGSLQGQARLRRFQILGEYVSTHRLRVRMYYDRDESPSETIVWDPSTVITSETWGSDDTWGDSPYWGGDRDGRTYQFEHRPRRQKFATIRFEISALSNTNGAAFELTELVLDLGVKPGLQKHATTRKY